MGDDALEHMTGLVLEDGRLWGRAAEDFQFVDAKAVLGDDGPRLHYITRPRGGSKTTDLAGMCICALLFQLPAGARAYAFAVDRDQAALLVDAIAGFVDRTPWLKGLLQVDNYRVTAKGGPSAGAWVRIEAADDASAWGLRGHFYVLDEFAQWKTTVGPRRLTQAILSAVPKVRGCRVVILTTAGDPAHPAARMRDLALARPDRWRVHEVPGPLPWVSADDLVEQKRLLPESQYLRLHMNVWVSAEDRLVSEADLRACVTLQGPLEPRSGVRYRIGVDVGLKKDRTAVAVCHWEDDRVWLDRLLVWEGTRDAPVQLELVQAAVLELSRRYHLAKVICDPYQAVQMMQWLRGRHHVPVEEYPFSAQSVGRLAVTTHRLLRDHQFALPDEPELIDELLNTRLKETSPGVYRIDHDPDRHDDRAIALSLAANSLAQRGGALSGYAVSAAMDEL